MKILKGGITTAKGFKANGIWCGIKRSGKPDLAILYCDKAIPTAGVFTKNSIIAAPLVVSKKHLRNCKAQAIIVNSGNANCFTGSFGLAYAKQTAQAVAQELNARPSDVIVSSTGIIGKPLPIDKIISAIPKLVSGAASSTVKGKQAAKGILTTDLTLKECAVQISLKGKKVIVGGCAKGSGMIEPNMATMLAFITTDAAIDAKILKHALREAVDSTFNCITIDGCMSTNDMVTLMANGLAGNKIVSTKGTDYKIFLNALQYVCLDLAKKIVSDGEGATKFITITVAGATTKRQAKLAAMKTANSNLVKTAAFGSNPNWGRVAAAVGSLGLKVTESNIKIKFSSFAKKNISIYVDLGLGKESATVFTSDLSYEYIRINGKYN